MHLNVTTTSITKNYYKSIFKHKLLYKSKNYLGRGLFKVQWTSLPKPKKNKTFLGFVHDVKSWLV